MKKGDLSKFIEDAVKWRVLDQTMAEARAGSADMPAEAVEAVADEAVTRVRIQTRLRRMLHSPGITLEPPATRSGSA